MAEPAQSSQPPSLLTQCLGLATETLIRSVVGGVLARTFTDLTFTAGAIIGASSIPITLVTAIALNVCINSDQNGNPTASMSNTIGFIGAPYLSNYIFQAINLPPVTPLTGTLLSAGTVITASTATGLICLAIMGYLYAIQNYRQEHAYFL